MMNIKVKCIDSSGTPHMDFFKSKRVFTAVGIVQLTGGPAFILKSMPFGSFGFLISRFVPLERITIKLPEDIQNIDL